MPVIVKFPMSTLHNEEHHQFHIGINALIVLHTATALGIENAYAVYLPILNKEGQVLDIVQGSAYTEALEKADLLRDTTYRGMHGIVKAYCNHHNTEINQASKRIMVLLDHYGNVPLKPYDDETAAINKLTADLNTNCAAEVAAIGISDWISLLQANNDAFVSVQKSRFTEDAGKPTLQMKIVRQELDDAFQTIVERINALDLINSSELYILFINEVNARISAYSNTLALRAGHHSKGGDTPPVVKE